MDTQLDQFCVQEKWVRLTFTHQPRAGDKSDAAALAFAGRMEDAMIEGGLRKVRIERLEDLSPIAVCVIGGGSGGEP